MQISVRCADISIQEQCGDCAFCVHVNVRGRGLLCVLRSNIGTGQLFFDDFENISPCADSVVRSERFLASRIHTCSVVCVLSFPKERATRSFGTFQSYPIAVRINYSLRNTVESVRFIHGCRLSGLGERFEEAVSEGDNKVGYRALGIGAKCSIIG